MEMKAKEMWYKEFATCMTEIREVEQGLCMQEKTKQRRKIIENVERLYSLSQIGRQEGLLMLEATICENEQNWPAEIVTGIKLVCDACESADIETILWNKYFVRQPKAYKALRYLMNMKGILEIQNGIHPYALNNLLCSMLPDEVENLYRGRPKLS